jgi:hypothetical protein
MKSEYLIWIIFFLVYMVFIFLKKTRAASKSEERGGGRSRPGLQGKLAKFLSRIKAEIEAANPEGSNEETGREEILPSEDQEPESIRQRISPAPTIKPAPAKAVVESMKPTVSKKENLPKDSVYGTQDLRKAVIWSEILAPPLALRDKYQGF